MMAWVVKDIGLLNQGTPATGRCTPGFLELLCPQMCVCVYVCVCLPPRLLITSGSNMFYGFYMADVVGIVSKHAVSIHMHCGN